MHSKYFKPTGEMELSILMQNCEKKVRKEGKSRACRTLVVV